MNPVYRVSNHKALLVIFASRSSVRVAFYMINFSYYLHEKAEESRHSELIAYSIAIMGSVFLVGGIVQTLITVQRPQWFLIFPYQIGASPYDFLGLGFTLVGVMLFLAGIILGVHYGAQRVWYTNSLKEAYRFEEEKLKAKNRGKSQVLEFPPQRATESPEPHVTTEEAVTEAAPNAQQT